MDAPLHVAVNGHQWLPEELTYQFNVQVRYKQLCWTVQKRYRDFDLLRVALRQSGLCLGVDLPPKNVVATTPTTKFLKHRQRGLNSFLTEVVRRPDTRSCEATLSFLSFAPYTNLYVSPLKPEMVKSVLNNSRMGVADVATVNGGRVLFVGVEDSSSVCRLGKVWSLIESEAIGCLHGYLKPNDDGVEGEEYQHSLELFVNQRCRAVAALDERRAMIGLDDGHIAIYDLEKELEQHMELHSESIVCFSRCGDRLLSVGFDQTIRVVDLSCTPTGVVSGGRLSRRLGSAQIQCAVLTTGGLRGDIRVAFLGTSAGQLMAYAVDSNPPIHLNTVQISDTPIDCLGLSKRNLLAGHGGTVTCFFFEASLEDCDLKQRGRFIMPASCGSVSALACGPQWLLAGCKGGELVVWSVETGRQLIAAQLHWQKIVKIELLSSEDKFLTASRDGNVKIWSVPASSDAVWSTWENDAREEDEKEAPSIDTARDENAAVAVVESDDAEPIGNKWFNDTPLHEEDEEDTLEGWDDEEPPTLLRVAGSDDVASRPSSSWAECNGVRGIPVKHLGVDSDADENELCDVFT